MPEPPDVSSRLVLSYSYLPVTLASLPKYRRHHGRGPYERLHAASLLSNDNTESEARTNNGHGASARKLPLLFCCDATRKQLSTFRCN